MSLEDLDRQTFFVDDRTQVPHRVSTSARNANAGVPARYDNKINLGRCFQSTAAWMTTSNAALLAGLIGKSVSIWSSWSVMSRGVPSVVMVVKSSSTNSSRRSVTGEVTERWLSVVDADHSCSE